MNNNSFQTSSHLSNQMDKALFNIDIEKALEVVVWLAYKKPHIDIYHIAKVLFFADKLHLNSFGRPVVGDNYVKMPYGPAPSTVLNIVNLNGFNIPFEFIDKIDTSITISGRYKNVLANREPDISYFSKSDIRCLEESLEKNGDKTFKELYDETHREKCYLETEDQGYIDFRLMVDDANEHGEEIKKFIFEQSLYTHC